LKRRLKQVFVVAAVVSALAAVSASPASAVIPKWIPGAGQAFPIGFEGRATGTTYLESNLPADPGKLIACTGAQVAGSAISSYKTQNFAIELLGCRETVFGHPVSGGGGGPGVIALKQNKAGPILVYLNHRSEGLVGLRLTIATTTLQIEEGGQFEVKGELLIPITPINTESRLFGITLNEKNSSEEYRLFEDGSLGCCSLFGTSLEINLNSEASQLGIQTPPVQLRPSVPMKIGA
jgi:hypothetical protein